MPAYATSKKAKAALAGAAFDLAKKALDHYSPEAKNCIQPKEMQALHVYSEVLLYAFSNELKFVGTEREGQGALHIAAMGDTEIFM
eukprot:7325155-Alexandrium_andersonii.AAC.1